jgi:hypothetical protein
MVQWFGKTDRVSFTSKSGKGSLLARTRVLNDLREGFIVEAHYLIDRGGDLGDAGFVGLQRFFDFDHAFLAEGRTMRDPSERTSGTGLELVQRG